MIYPQKLNSKKSDKIIKILALISIGIAIILLVINKITTPGVPWAALSNCGIIYCWITVIYSVRNNTNIAGHVLIQTIALSALTIYIDYKIGFKGWSLDIAIPIMIIIANITMCILTIVSYKRYIKYAIYQLMIVLFSMIPIVLITENIINNKTLSIIATSISIANFILSLALCSKDVKEAIVRKFHM